MEEKIYKIEIEEVLQRVVDIKAKSLEDAINKVNDKYQNEEIVLDYADYFETKIREYNSFRPRAKYNSHNER